MKMKSPNFNQIPNSDHIRTPRMLKDFLTDDPFNSSPSHRNGFRSFSTSPSHSAIGQNLPTLTTKTRSASTTISAIVNALKNIHFAVAVKSSSNILPRSLSWTWLPKKTTIMCRDHRQIKETQIQLNALTIKDIIRWKSFRDLADELDISPQYHCIATTTTTSSSTATTSPCGSSGSSWCGSDFTAEYLPWWRDENGGLGRKCLRRVGEEQAETATKTKSEVGPESPILIMENTFEEERWSSSFNQRYFTVENIKLEKWMSRSENTDFDKDIEAEEEEMKDIEVQEKAWQLFNHIVKDQKISLVNEHCNESEKRVVWDFIKEELSREDKEEMVIRRVKDWINGEDKVWIGWDKKEAYVREMEKNGKWSKFEEEEEEMAMEIENGMVDFFVDELLIDLIMSSS